MHREVSNFFGLGAEGIELGQEDPDTEQVTIEIPQGASEGQTIEFQLADGRVANATVPAGKGPGSTITISVPKAKAGDGAAPTAPSGGMAPVDEEGGHKEEMAEFTLPPGSVPGQTITVMLAGNRETLVQVPAGAVAGQTITIAVPALAGREHYEHYYEQWKAGTLTGNEYEELMNQEDEGDGLNWWQRYERIKGIYHHLPPRSKPEFQYVATVLRVKTLSEKLTSYVSSDRCGPTIKKIGMNYLSSWESFAASKPTAAKYSKMAMNATFEAFVKFEVRARARASHTRALSPYSCRRSRACTGARQRHVAQPARGAAVPRAADLLHRSDRLHSLRGAQVLRERSGDGFVLRVRKSWPNQVRCSAHPAADYQRQAQVLRQHGLRLRVLRQLGLHGKQLS